MLMLSKGSYFVAVLYINSNENYQILHTVFLREIVDSTTELTFNYGSELLHIACECGSANCGGTIGMVGE